MEETRQPGDHDRRAARGHHRRRARLTARLIRAYDWFGGKTAHLQIARRGSWQTVATAKLVKRGTAGQYAQTRGTFTKKVGHGLYRAVLPTRSAAPCYVAGFSGTLRL